MFGPYGARKFSVIQIICSVGSKTLFKKTENISNAAP